MNGRITGSAQELGVSGWPARFRRWLRDPLGIDRAIGRDWEAFALMTDDELEREFDTLLVHWPRSARFRRLMHFLSIRWLRNRKRPSDKEFSQADVDKIVARAKELGASDGLTYKNGHLRLSSYAEPHNAEALAMLLINGWHDKWDLIWVTTALTEFLSTNQTVDLATRLQSVGGIIIPQRPPPTVVELVRRMADALENAKTLLGEKYEFEAAAELSELIKEARCIPRGDTAEPCRL